MNQSNPADIEPVVASISVQATPTRAFEFFTADMSRWWPPVGSVSPSRSPIHHDYPAVEAVPVVELCAGGRWYEHATDGGECDWGRVLVWERPERLVLAWQIGEKWHFDPALLTEVEIRFDAQSPKITQVHIEHRLLERYGAAADVAHSSLASSSGWDGLLKIYAAALVQSES